MGAWDPCVTEASRTLVTKGAAAEGYGARPSRSSLNGHCVGLHSLAPYISRREPVARERVPLSGPTHNRSAVGPPRQRAPGSQPLFQAQTEDECVVYAGMLSPIRGIGSIMPKGTAGMSECAWR